jgi:hypothetical protein
MEKWSLTALADGLLSHALSASSRRDMRTIDGGRPHLLYQSVIALARGQRIEEHDNPGEATVQVLRGRVRVTAGEDTTERQRTAGRRGGRRRGGSGPTSRSPSRRD